MTPLEVVATLVSGMDAGDRQTVAELLGVNAAPPLTVCQRSGHRYRKFGHTAPSWFTPSRPILICERCGRERN